MINENMSNRIYYKEFPEPKPYKYLLSGKEISGDVSGEWLCENPEIEKVWFTASLGYPDESKMNMQLNIFFKNGNRHDFQIKEADQTTHETLVKMAEEYLNNCGKGIQPYNLEA